jgi:hypothetical protein
MPLLARRSVKARDLPKGWVDDARVPPETEVVVTVETKNGPPRRRLVDFIGRGRGCYASVEEVDALLRAERDAWQR